MADETNQKYYLNLKTGNSQWNDPSEEQKDTVEVDYTDTAPSLFEEEEQMVCLCGSRVLPNFP